LGSRGCLFRLSLVRSFLITHFGGNVGKFQLVSFDPKIVKAKSEACFRLCQIQTQ
jgi:hypothetical protein